MVAASLLQQFESHSHILIVVKRRILHCEPSYAKTSPQMRQIQNILSESIREQTVNNALHFVPPSVGHCHL